MAATAKSSMDYWRSFFRAANSDIFGIIDHAIMVAAADCPKEFRLRRDRVAELLFSSRMSRCSGCDKVELVVPCDHEIEDVDDRGREFGAGASKESKVNSSGDNDDQVKDSNYSYGLAEALTDEIEEESQVFEEVLRIKEVFHNSEHESDAVLYESLRKLELMALSVETLKATEIGKAVNRLRKHGSAKIRNLVRTLIDGWKVMVDEWVNATTAIASGGTEVISDDVDPSVDDDFEEGLPTPPLDEGAFFATQTASMELSEFFDGMEDYGNPRNNGQYGRNRGNGRKPSLVVKQEPQYLSDEGNVPPRKIKSEPVMVKQEVDVMKPNRPSNTSTGPRRPPKISMEQKGVSNVTNIVQRTDTSTIQKRQVTGQQQDKYKCSDEVAVQVKLEATKRKLQESYQQAENAKKQRTVQVMELHDLPKQGLGHRNPHLKPGNHNRQRALGRRF
ncbi:probable mediator of RNA polymerase II transcription subunit 26b [Argentina anserina]|uniref:probable mediator of RNA polymerase II transcription subunit 26b n=1 Tax=Argentina anserina TaxID=57926 RepID=UPI00217635F9|nr:probable mediator of RNA polymerase II transcription subunit 26b [Potentilla anserina]